MTLACVAVSYSYIMYARLENVRISNAEKVSLRDNNLDETRRILLLYIYVFIGTPIYTSYVCWFIYLMHCNEEFV